MGGSLSSQRYIFEWLSFRLAFIKNRLDECDRKNYTDQKDPGGRCDCANASRVFCRLRYHGKLKKPKKKYTFARPAFFPLEKRLLNVRRIFGVTKAPENYRLGKNLAMKVEKVRSV